MTNLSLPKQGMLSGILTWVSSSSALLWATFLMEAMWFYLWMIWLGQWDSFGIGEMPFTPLSILLILWASYYGVQVIGQQKWATGRTRLTASLLVVVLLGAVARLENGGGYSLLDPGWLGFARESLVGGIPTGLQVTLLGGAYLWWRGFRIAQEGLDREQVLTSFKVGLTAIVLGLLVWETALRSGTEFGATRTQAIAIVSVFFLAGVSALALSHIMRARADLARHEGLQQSFIAQWSVVLLGVAGGMLLLGWILTGLLSLDVWQPLLTVLAFAANLMGLLVYVILLPIAFLAAGLVFVVQWLVSQFGGGTVPTLELPDFSALRRIPEEGDPVTGTSVWVAIVKWVMLVLVLSALVYLLARLVLRRRSSFTVSESVPDEVNESIGTWSNAIRDLLTGLIMFALWFRHKGRALRRKVPLLQTSPAPSYQSDMEIRDLYSSLLYETRQAGFPKEESQTPYDYLPELEQRLVDDREALQTITKDYVENRYGERPIEDAELSMLNRLWRTLVVRIRSTGNRKKS